MEICHNPMKGSRRNCQSREPGQLLEPRRSRPASQLMRVLLRQMVCARTHQRASESGLRARRYASGGWARFVTPERHNLWQGREELSPTLRSEGNHSLRNTTSQRCFALDSYVKQRLVPVPECEAVQACRVPAGGPQQVGRRRRWRGSQVR